MRDNTQHVFLTPQTEFEKLQKIVIFWFFPHLIINNYALIKDVTKVFGNLNLINSSLENTGKISTVHGDVSIGDKHSLKDISSLKEIYGSVLIHSDSKEEAYKTLRKLKFNPKKFIGKVIVL